MSVTFSCKDITGIRKFYEENGYVTIDDLIGLSDLSILKKSFDEAVGKGDIVLDDEVMVECNDAIYRHPIFEKYVKHQPIVELVEKLLRCEGLELQHSKLNSKPMADKGEGIVDWHQDYPFFPHSNFDLLAVGIHFDDEDEDSGPLMVVPGSHKLGPLNHCDNESFAYKCTDAKTISKLSPVRICCKAGYVTIHHCLTLHFSDHKKNNKHRRLLVYQYRALDNIQLAGVIWKCTGLEIKPGKYKGFAKFNDGTRVELRGKSGRLYDKFGKLAPDKDSSSTYKT